MKVCAVLEVMWDWRNQTSSAGYQHVAPRHFRINPNNFSGRRLYKLVGDAQLIVTNACSELVTSAKQHGVPNPVWLTENLLLVEPIDVLLLCGKVAQQTYKACSYTTTARVIEIPHPAARGYWTKATIEATQKLINENENIT